MKATDLGKKKQQTKQNKNNTAHGFLCPKHFNCLPESHLARPLLPLLALSGLHAPVLFPAHRVKVHGCPACKPPCPGRTSAAAEGRTDIPPDTAPAEQKPLTPAQPKGLYDSPGTTLSTERASRSREAQRGSARGRRGPMGAPAGRVFLASIPGPLSKPRHVFALPLCDSARAALVWLTNSLSPFFRDYVFQ